MERSIHSAQFVFVELQAECGIMDRYTHSVAFQHYKHFTSNSACAVDLFLYLEVDPEVAFERIKKRGRPEEVGMTLGYLKTLAKKHEEFLGSHNPCQVLRVDGNQSKADVFDEVIEKLMAIPEIGKWL
jgi:deoxyadenosine/deoxycytidine kinase